jgi:TatD DNase family protein
MKIIDAHSHLEYISYKAQPDIVGTVCCATNEDDWSVLLNMNDKNVFPAFGIHPWFLENIKDGFDVRLSEMLEQNKSAMVGEIGLDKYKPDMDKQIEVFIKQLEIAIKYKRPVFIHCVGAWDKIFQILKRYKKYELPIMVAHAFNGSIEIIENLITGYNIMFSFNRVDNIIKNIPDDRILVETDAKSNVVLSDIVDKIADIKNNENMADIIYQNTMRVLNND